MSERKAVIVKFPLDEFEAIEAARGDLDRSTWIRARLREALALAGAPLLSSTEAPLDGEHRYPPARW